METEKELKERKELKEATWASMKGALEQAAELRLPALQQLPSKEAWQGSTAQTLGIRGFQLRRLDNSLQNFGKARAEYETRVDMNRQRLEKLLNGQDFGEAGSRQWHKEAQRYFDGEKKVLQAYESAVGALDQSIKRFDSWKQHSAFSYKRLDARRPAAVADLADRIAESREDLPGHQRDAANSRGVLTTANTDWRRGRSTLSSLHRSTIRTALGQILRGHLKSGLRTLDALYSEPARRPPSVDFLRRPSVVPDSGFSVRSVGNLPLRSPQPSRPPALRTIKDLEHAAVMPYGREVLQQRSDSPPIGEMRSRSERESLQRRPDSPRRHEFIEIERPARQLVRQLPVPRR